MKNARVFLLAIFVTFLGCSDIPAEKIDKIYLTQDDITDRPYKILGDINVTAKKLTIFSRNPTREDVDRKLKEKAVGLGADAVIYVRYGTPGIGLWSWDQLDGAGRAVRFNN
ncbi:Hypothetical protein GbCGDNIH3_7004 [Granulibacter bethesdensis]|uniref:Uncharacterized protein n=1 Tax=Granulibacter bethesdensis TaxID=364410 RepID=A0AAN0REM8_9PROT|nr:hypothetical protein [Granulibacter bethesdensis]AHJ63487.1 Hypothetical protein GbCGDNIH3_7004 [Granulibacter bethesdensis]